MDSEGTSREVTSREVTRDIVSLPNNPSNIGEIANVALKTTVAIGEMLPFAAAACQLASQIIDMVESAQRHKKICKDLSRRIDKATKRIQANTPTKDVSLAIQVSYLLQSPCNA
ncbi:10003_t:CDS:1 [Ambispora gerdemannii]|uniref:10003_t:CDS:1 n=1 Tax=Ambispora gerdemannii TaxID=144530 RepID=A0A9N9DLL4_9GLOM|nr:10003_t:CDS:1 [Ambispora gerdemannii]